VAKKKSCRVREAVLLAVRRNHQAFWQATHRA
jgi:hypothetical protein